jgi:hypothetical protein
VLVGADLYFYDLPTTFKTIRAKEVMFCVKLKLMKCRLEVTHFYDLLTYLKTFRGMPTSRKEDIWQNNTRVFDLIYFLRSQRSKFIWVRLPIIPQLQFKLCQLSARPLGLLFYYFLPFLNFLEMALFYHLLGDNWFFSPTMISSLYIQYYPSQSWTRNFTTNTLKIIW